MKVELQQVYIEGFLNTLDISVPLNPDMTFLIGRNGTGKTAFIRILHACLALDITELANLPFRSATLRFVDVQDKRRKPRLTVTKTGGTKSPHATIALRLIGKEEIYTEAALTRGHESFPSPRHSWQLPHLFGLPASDQPELAYARANISKVCRFTWLPIQRVSTISTDPLSSESISQPVDSKIEQISIGLTKFLSSLDSHYNAVLSEFQRKYFLSFFDVDYDTIGQRLHAPTFDLEAEKRHFFDIFSAFQFPSHGFQASLDKYFSSLAAAIQRVRDKSTSGITVSDAVRFIDANRLHGHIIRWQELQQTRAEIYRIRDLFAKTLTDLYLRKSVSFDNRNQPVVEAEGG